MSVWHNGILIHDNVELGGAPDQPGPLPVGPILLQDHGNPVRCREHLVVRAGSAPRPIAARS